MFVMVLLIWSITIKYISLLPFWYHIIWKPDVETVESVLNTMLRAELVVLPAGGGVYPQNVPIRGASWLGPS